MKLFEFFESRDMCNVCGQTPCNCTHLTESVANPGRRLIGLFNLIYRNGGDDAVDYLLYNSPIFADYYDQYEGDIESIAAEVNPKELQVMVDELEEVAENEGLAENVDIGREWMSDTELDQYVPDALEQEWRELVGYNEDGNAHPLWINMTGDYEPRSSDPQHRAWMVKVANKWFAKKRIPNVKFFDVRDHNTEDELEWLVQIGPQGVAEDTLNEYRNALYDFVKSKFPTWPEYVLKDFLYAQAKGIRDEEELKDWLERNQKDFGRVKWRLEKLPITLDIFTPRTQRMIKQREGGSSNPFQVPRDAERHAQQLKMIQQQGVRTEPIIVAKLSNGYDLIEGWHRTIQHLQQYPEGYTGPAWVAYGATYTSESKQGVAEGLNDTVYPNAEVIKSKNGKPVGEIYQDDNGWGCFHYRADRGYDTIDSREDAIQALKDLHSETARHRPDFTIKGVAEGSISTYVLNVIDEATGEHWAIEIQATSPDMAKERARQQGYKVLRIKEKGMAEGSDVPQWRVEQSDATGRYYVVTGYTSKSRRVWKSKQGAGDFNKKENAEAKAQELNRGMAEGSLNELSPGLLQRAAQGAKVKRDQAMDPEVHSALGGGYMNPLAKHYDTVSKKFGDKAVKAGQRDAVKKIASPAVMRKLGLQGVAEGLNEFAPGGGGDNGGGDNRSPELYKIARKWYNAKTREARIDIEDMLYDNGYGIKDFDNSIIIFKKSGTLMQQWRYDELTDGLAEGLGRDIDYTSLEVDGIHSWDSPDYSDAYFSYGEYIDGTPLPDDVLDQLSSNGDLLHKYIQNKLYEGPVTPVAPMTNPAKVQVQPKQNVHIPTKGGGSGGAPNIGKKSPAAIIDIQTPPVSEDDDKLVDFIYSELEKQFPDVVSKFGHEVVGDAINDTAVFYKDASAEDITAMVQQVVNTLQHRTNSLSETRLYYNTIGTPAAHLRKEFKMRKDPSGWFLKENADSLIKLEALRAFGNPVVKKKAK